MQIPAGRPPLPRFAGFLAACLGLITAAGADQPGADSAITGVVVDEAGKPVAGATVRALNRGVSGPVETDADGRFRITQDRIEIARPNRYAVLLARGGEGRLGLAQDFREQAGPVKVVLKPARTVDVRVVDRDGRPVEGADVAFMASLFHLLGEGRTDAEGRWRLDVPADTKVWGVYALKPKLGFDYAPGERDWARSPLEPIAPMPDRVTLTLDGARPPVRIKAVDGDGKPLAGVTMLVTVIAKPGREAQANLASESGLWPTTGDDGCVTLDWLPEHANRALSVYIRSTAYYLPGIGPEIPDDPRAGELVIPLLPFERLGGRITTADGRPAQGARVRVGGAGAGGRSFFGEARSDAEGRYALDVYSEQVYTVAASKGDLAAPYKTGVVVRAGKPAEGVDLPLGRATIVRGRVTVGEDRRPAGSITVQAVIDGGGLPPELRRASNQSRASVELFEWRQTDEEGRYEFALGPGAYRLQGPPRVEAITLTIPPDDPPAEVVQDFAMPRPEDGPLKVAVVDADGRPVAGAVVEGEYASRTFSRWIFPKTKTDAGGTTAVTRSLDPLVLRARTPDGRAGIARVDAEAAEVRVVAGPTATASGRFVDPAGKPLIDRELIYSIRVPPGPPPRSGSQQVFGGRAPVDHQGRFTVPGLVVGEAYEMFVTGEDGRSGTRAEAKLAPIDAGPFALGDVIIKARTDTPTDRAVRAFASTAGRSLQDRLDNVLIEAQRAFTRPLLLFAAPKDPACIDLFRVFDETSGFAKPSIAKTPADLRREFELAPLDTGSATVRAFAKDLGVPIGDGKPPSLAVLTDDGTLGAAHPLVLGADRKLDAAALGAFLSKHTLPTRDAEAMLAAGLAMANGQGKRAFLIFSNSWSSLGRGLGRFLAANRAELDRHYVFVRLDVERDAHAEAIRRRVKGDDPGDVPWYAILDEAGNPLVNSDSVVLAGATGRANIGYPRSKEGIDHFIRMLKETAPRLTEEALASLRKSLTARP